jgi:serine/threonine protein kinase
MHTNWEVGQTIDGLYEIFGSSSGGMGAVYFVNHLKWEIPLAVKTPLITLINSPSAYRRYIKEAETWINIGMHPHIVSCFYVRDLGGIPRIFIEYVSGGTLKDLIDKQQLGDISYVLDLAIQFSMAMEYVHDHGIIHRATGDLKEPFSWLLGFVSSSAHPFSS